MFIRRATWSLVLLTAIVFQGCGPKASVSEKTAAPFHFTLTGDPRSGLSKWQHTLKQMKEQVGGVGAFHITAGDYFEDDHSTLASHFYDEMVAEFGPDVVWYPGLGNHEVQREQHDLLWLQQFYRDKLQGKVTPGPQGSEETAYSWDYRNAHFVQIDMYFDGEKHRKNLGFTDQTLDWLEKDLDKNTKPVVFVIYHEPAWPNDRGGKDSPDNWQKFMKIVNDRKVVAGLCADTHTYGRTQVPGPWESVTWEIDAGNAGRLSHGDKHQTFVDIIVKTDGTVEFNTWQGLEGEDFKITDSWTAKAGAGRNTGKLLVAENKGYTELVVSPNTPTENYYKISAIAKPLETLVVPQGTTHTVTGKERYSSFEVAGTLIVEKGGELTAGLGTDQPRSTIDGLEAKVIVNGGAINLKSRINVGNASNATIIMNGGLFRIGDANSIDDFGDIKLPDEDGGTQRIILNGGLLWVHRCQIKITETDDAQIIVAGGEMRLDMLGDDEPDESYVPDGWLTAGKLLLAENKGYTELVVSPNTPTENYYKISAIAKPLEALVVPQGTTHTVTGKERYSSFEVAGTLIVEKGGELTAGLGTNKPRSTIDGPEAKLIVNGGAINLNSRINVGIADNATIIMNDGLFRIGLADSNDEVGDIKLPDETGGTQRIILNGGLLWAHRCQIKIAETDDAQIIVGGGEMRLDILGDNEPTESYVPDGWVAAGKLLVAENKGYTDLVISPNTLATNYYKISAIPAKKHKQE